MQNKDDIQQKIITAEQELRDLKTAQAIPGYVSMNRSTGTIPARTYSGTYTWTIHYEDVGDTNPPITMLNTYATGDTLLPYDPSTNTQKFEMHRTNETVYVATTFTVISTRTIASITQDF